MSLPPRTEPNCQGAAADARLASPWVKRWTHLIPPGGEVLDVACGQGRHLAWLVEQGHRAVGVDRSAAALANLGLPGEQCRTVLADIEQGPWPFPGQLFAGVVVTNYLWRPLLPTLMASVAPGGVLIYETFAQGQETVGKPSRPDFLLQAGELLSLCRSWRTVAFEDGYEDGAEPEGPGRFVQRIVAVRPPAQADAGPGPARHRLR